MDTLHHKRILALDILRGITICGMILVSNPGTWNSVYAPLKHAEWIGLTPTDLIFPFFMFIMGFSIYISLQKYNFKISTSVVIKIIRRTIILFIIGIALSWFSNFCSGIKGLSKEHTSFITVLVQSAWNFDHVRIMGVLQRFALCYCATAFIALTIKHKRIPYLIILLLIGYFLILVAGNGFVYNDTNFLSIFDSSILGDVHMYKEHGIEPEGILSTIPAIAHVLLGFYIGELVMTIKNMKDKIEKLFIVGTILTVSGFLLSYGCPLCKKIWSPSFVFVTCGLCSSILALLIWVVDIKGYSKWGKCFETFGVNPLFMYVISEAINIIVGNIIIKSNGGSNNLQCYIYNRFIQPVIPDYLGSLTYAILFVCVIWIFSYILYKKKIYIKI